MIKIVVAGAAGRMGRRILTCASQDNEVAITGVLEHPENALIGHDLGDLIGTKAMGIVVSSDLSRVLSGADVMIDFSHHSVTRKHLQAAVEAKTALVVGTTNLDGKIIEELKAASQKIAVVQAPNMSVGMNVLFRLAEISAKALDESYDLEITEAHHRMKKDAPSGTAVKLLGILAAARGRDPKKHTVYGREGEPGARPKGEIGVFALRGGDVVGDHTVSFMGDGERIELIHRATSRDAFAYGAIRAAKFAAKKKSGFFDMRQVLGIS